MLGPHRAQTPVKPGKPIGTTPAVIMPPDLAARGRCAQPGADPELWFTPGREKRAAAACRACPVIDGCAEWAAACRPAFGVWAGMTPAERNRRRREQQRTEAS
jgi:WhiB family redox-sensing transcriptional regulator